MTFPASRLGPLPWQTEAGSGTLRLPYNGIITTLGAGGGPLGTTFPVIYPGITEIGSTTNTGGYLAPGAKAGEVCVVINNFSGISGTNSFDVYAPGTGSIINGRVNGVTTRTTIPPFGGAIFTCRGNDVWQALVCPGEDTSGNFQFGAVTLSAAAIDLTPQGGTALFRTFGVIKTADYSVAYTDTQKVFSNTGASGQVIFTLPTPVATVYVSYTFIVAAAQNLRVLTSGGGILGIGANTGTANGYTESSTVNSVIRVTSGFNSTAWIAEHTIGTWANPT